MRNMPSSEIAKIQSLCSTSTCRPHAVSTTAGFNGKQTVTAHLFEGAGNRAARSELLKSLKKTGISARFRVKTRKSRKIEEATSLQAVVAPFDGAALLFDPTGAFGRATALVDYAIALRTDPALSVQGVYWNANWRTIFVVLDPNGFFTDDKVSTADLGQAEQTIVQTLVGESAEKPDFVSAIRIGFELPSVPVTAIDGASYLASRRLPRALGSVLKLPLLAGMIGLAGVSGAMAQDSGPAVSAMNGKIALEGGTLTTTTFGTQAVRALSGSLTFPVQNQFGVQLDAGAGQMGADSFTGAGAHLFWRDPSRGMVDLQFGATFIDRTGVLVPDQTAYAIGVEGELYLDQFTIAANAGRIFGTNVTVGDYYGVDLSWYASNNLKLRIGYGQTPDVNGMANAGIEWMPMLDSLEGMAVYADYYNGTGYENIGLGVRFYFGEGKSLKDRHRRDDPERNLALGVLNGGGGANAY